jgi:hypothetical protein
MSINEDSINKAIELLNNPPQKTEVADSIAFARIVAGSHCLEGINTSVEEVLKAAGIDNVNQ